MATIRLPQGLPHPAILWLLFPPFLLFQRFYGHYYLKYSYSSCSMATITSSTPLQAVIWLLFTPVLLLQLFYGYTVLPTVLLCQLSSFSMATDTSSTPLPAVLWLMYPLLASLWVLIIPALLFQLFYSY